LTGDLSQIALLMHQEPVAALGWTPVPAEAGP